MSNFQINEGLQVSAIKTVIYGPEGIGKTTFAACFPNPLFIDTEGSTKFMNVRRLPTPTSWQMLKDEIDHVKQNPTICDTLVIDTFDWAETHCIKHICDNANKKGIEDFGYGKGYIYEKEEIARFLHSLEDVVALGIHVVLTAHAQLRKVEQPENTGTYDHWEMKLGQKTGSLISPMVKEWADLLLFANYKTVVVTTEDGKHKAQGGRRVMYTTHTPWWDAKNRFMFPDELEFNFSEIARVILQRNQFDSATQKIVNAPLDPLQIIEEQPEPVPEAPPAAPIGKQIPKALADLMAADRITEADIQLAVATQGIYPPDVPVADYDSSVINGMIIAQWDGLKTYINQLKGE